jgi:hypothetical protein
VLLTTIANIIYGNMELTQLSIRDLQRLTRSLIYNVSIAALGEKGSVKKDLLSIRKELKNFMKKLKNGKIDYESVSGEFGFIVLALAIIKTEAHNDRTIEVISKIENMLYS